VNDLHLTKKDFKLEWYSGQGAGGQHRNKHQNCCRITHLESGLVARGTEARDRVTNQRVAFQRLAKEVINWYDPETQIERRTSNGATDVIRTYHAVRNEVLDKASGKRLSYKEVVINGDIGTMVEARKGVMGDESETD